MRKIWDFHGGIHPPENKHQSVGSPIRSAGIPPQLTLPLRQHIGAAAEPVVAVGQSVGKGELLARAVGLISVPVHAPTSGVVSAIEDRLVPHVSGLPATCVVLDTDGRDEWIERRPVDDWRRLEKTELLKLIREAGIAGMGGAGFPTAVKLNVNPKSGHIDTLIINGTECEPYITADDILMRERARDIVRGTEILQHLLEPGEVLLGIEDNKPEAIAAMREAAQGTGFEVVVFPTKYPSGGEKQLIEILTGKQVPSGGLPADVGVVCQNVASAAAVYQAVCHAEPLISRITTVTGDAVREPQNFETLLGTPMRFLLEQAGYQPDAAQRVVMGGPMMGFTVPDIDVPVIKTTNCLLVPTDAELPLPPPAQPCIRCGLCAEACPARLLPQQLYWFSRGKEYDKLEAHNLFDCIECGACSYACPSNIPLVQYYRASKAEVTLLRRDQARAEHSKTRFEARQERVQRQAEEKEAQRQARKKAAEERARQAAETGDETLDPIKAAVERAQARRAADAESPRDKAAQPPPAAAADPAQLAIERAMAARSAAAEQSPLEQARDKLKRLQERLAKSETKLEESRRQGDDAKVSEALEAAIEKLKPKVAAAEQELAAFSSTQRPAIAQLDPAQLAIEKAKAARAANADQTPEDKARAALQRLQERLAKSEAKLAESRAQGAEDNVVDALEAAIEKLKPKLAAAEQEVAALAPADAPAESTAEPDPAQQAIEKAKAARAAAAAQSPADKARANLVRLQERLARSETKLAESREEGADDTVIAALESAIDKLKPKLAAAEQEVAALHSDAPDGQDA